MKETALILGLIGAILIFIALSITIGEIFGFLTMLYFWGVIMLLVGFILYRKGKLNEDDL